MRKFSIIVFSCMMTLGASAQANLFDAADVDADGWLWFDAQEKIDKYVGLIDEDNYKLNVNGKPIQLVYADQFPVYPTPEADPDVYGAGTDGELNGADAKKGAIVLGAASGIMNYNGGGIALMLPSCRELSIMCSSEASFYMRFLCSKENDAVFSKDNTGESYKAHEWSNIKSYTMFGAPSAGQYTFTGIESMTNGYYDLTIKSEESRYVYITHGRQYPVYVHGVKVLTYETTGIRDITANGDTRADREVYSIDGKRISGSSQLKGGVYVVRQGGKSYKVIF